MYSYFSHHISHQRQNSMTDWLHTSPQPKYNTEGISHFKKPYKLPFFLCITLTIPYCWLILFDTISVSDRLSTKESFYSDEM